jgi:DNA helicase II / ATP-dependent DNA helicase PcrA
MDLLNDLTPEQQQAVTHKGSPLLILAGAGSGKTRALTYRAAYLIGHHKISPEQILLTTFTNKAANEIQERIAKLTHHKLPFAGTFHSLCARMLRTHGPKIGIGHDFVIYDTGDQLDAIKLIMAELDIDPQLVKPRGVIAAIDSAKNELIFPHQYQQFARGPFQQAVANIYPRYQSRLLDFNALDFTDLLTKTVQLFQDVSTVRDYYRQQFQHLLIDEYQDTNRAQYTLTKLWLGDHQNLCVVGDASQAIYSWRGADYHNLMSLKVDFPNLTTIKLEQNFRSTQNILDAAFGVIHQNELHPILKLWTDTLAGDKVTVYQARDEYDEARFIAKKILAYQDEGHNLADSAVLFRTNAQSRVFEEVLMERGIPYVLVGGVKFYERKEIKDVLSYVRFAYNQRDKVSLGRIEKLGKRRLATFLSYLQTADLEQKPHLILDQILSASSYLDRFDVHDPEDQSRIENVAELKSVASNFTDLGSLLENIALAEQDSRKRDQSDAAVLMTLHASKGLEFDQVFVAGLEEGIFPHSRSLNSKPDLEEERRLCYVGMTRARKKLFLSYAQSRLYFGIHSQNLISRFVDELPTEVVNFIGVKSQSSHQPVDDSVVSDFLSGKIDIDTFLDS